MKQVKVSLDQDDIYSLEDLSRKSGHSISALIRSAVKSMLKATKE